MPPIRFGPEFTFAPEEGEVNLEAVTKKMWNHLVKGQPAGSKFTKKELESSRGVYVEFTSPNGWSFTLSLDPGVVEVQMKPQTTEIFEHFESDMQDAIFASASNARHFPADFVGGGHINIDTTAFQNNLLLYRNFIVDLYNHNELFMGIFGYDTNNALSWNLKDVFFQFKGLIDAFDRGAYANDFEHFNIQLREVLNTEVDKFYGVWGNPMREPRAHAVNFNAAYVYNRLEIRAVRPQANMGVWNRQIRLLQSRLEYLEKIDKPIPINARVPIAVIDFERQQHHLNPPVRSQDALRSFYMFVQESGLNWQDHRDYLWPNWMQNGELERFEKSDWFRKHEAGDFNQSCEERLLNF